MKAVAITGYFRTGSGAVYNLLQEYNSITDAGLTENYEHIFLYTIHGVFETIDRLLYANSLFNSNAAINEFYQEMKRLNDYDFIWYGGYKFRYGNQFMQIIDEFIADITEYHITRDWYGTEAGRKVSVNRMLRDSANGIIGRKKFNHNFGTEIATSENLGCYSFASEEKLQQACRKLINSYVHMIAEDEDKTLILNHMLSPMDAYRLENYCPDNFSLIIVDRDIRDIYTYNSHMKVWDEVTFPTELNEFISFYRGYRGTERPAVSDRILRVQYEDMAYQYDETIAKIENFLQLSGSDHTAKKAKFDPKIARNNTQLFHMSTAAEADADEIARAFPELIYHFPYEVKHNHGTVF